MIRGSTRRGGPVCPPKWLFILFVLLCSGMAIAADFDLVLQWDENSEPDLATGPRPRYKIYYKVNLSGAGLKLNYVGQPSTEPSRADEGVSPVSVTVALDENPDPALVQFTLHNLNDGQAYYIAVTAMDESGNESDLSNEVSTGSRPGKPIIAITKENRVMFLISDPQPKENVDYFEIEMDGNIVRADAEVAGDVKRLHHDLSGISMGAHTVRVRAMNDWGAGAWSDPLAFTAALPGRVSGVGLSAE